MNRAKDAAVIMQVECLRLAKPDEVASWRRSEARIRAGSTEANAMELGDGSALSPIASASVLMLRDGRQGLEVYLLRRHNLSDVLGGAYVFPGGKLDARDREWIDRLDTPMAFLQEALGEPELTEVQAAALFVAAIREVFEEAGVLFAASPPGAATFDASMMHSRRFDQVMNSRHLPLAASQLVPWSRWTTPVASVRSRKHFDARFFVAGLPHGQEPRHDDHETTESLWRTPRGALEDYWSRKIELAPPQIMTMAHLVRFRDVASVLREARSRKPPHAHPEAIHEGGAPVVCFPGDARHTRREAVLPGPSRLYWRDERYEPEGGLEALMA
jgi:8-oxo-dGTP pyrophosphatase MutT (NUDIX family)